MMNRKRLVHIGLPILFVLIICSLLPSSSARGVLVTTNQKIQELDEDVQGYLVWLKAHGIQSEISLVASISDKIISHGAALVDGHETNKLAIAYLGFLRGVLRVIFACVASLRLWVMLFAAVAFISFRNWRPYIGEGVLGVTGNGKLFFSGVHVDLSNLTDSGEPALLIPGLACPKSKNANEVAQSELGKLLRNYQALNKTTAHLAGVILTYPEVPFFAATAGDQERLATFNDPLLTLGAMMCVEEALFVHRTIKEGGKIEDATINPVTERESYRIAVRQGLFRVLTDEMRVAIAQLHATDVAALVLSYQAGKVLGYLREGNRWSRRTSYIHLNGRAVLHSIASYSKEFSFQARAVIRKALVYGMRFSVFGPIRLPLDMPPAARALRQWTELFMAYPHELVLTTDELEFYARASEVWKRWEKRFVEAIGAHAPEIINSARVTDSGALFISIRGLLALLRSVVSRDEIQRIERLVLAIGQMQRIHEMSKDLVSDAVSDEGVRGPLPQFQRVFAQLSPVEVKALSSSSDVSVEELKEWLIVRNIFHTFGWLARQVGSSSVPDHSCVAVVFKGIDGASSRSILGAKGMIPLRGSYLEERLGKFWRSRFASAQSATIADTEENYQKLLQGIDIYAIETEIE